MKGRSEKISKTHLVQKSTPLTSLIASDLTLFEFKILDIYLSKIDSHNPSERKVTFTKDELQKVLGVTQIKPNELNSKLKHLMGRVLEIRDERKEKGFTLLNLFSKAECGKDEFGEWKVELSCSHEAREYIFNIESIGYLRYKLRSVVDLDSRYSYVLFLYLESNKFRGTWNVGLEQLKQLLGCADDALYSEYKRFNERILRRSKEEIENKTSLLFTYSPVRLNRKVSEIQFTVLQSYDTLYNATSKDKVSIDPETENFNTKVTYGTNEEKNQIGGEEVDEEVIEFYQTACDNEFSASEIRCLLAIIETREFHSHPLDMDRGTRFARHQYLQYWYNRMNTIAEKNEIKNRFSYYMSMVQTDMKEYANNR